MSNIINKTNYMTIVDGEIELDEKIVITNNDIIVPKLSSVSIQSGLFVECGCNQNIFVRCDIENIQGIISPCLRFSNDSDNNQEMVLRLYNITQEDITIPSNTPIYRIFNTTKTPFDNNIDNEGRVMYNNDGIVIIDNNKEKKILGVTNFEITSDNISRLTIEFKKDVYENPLAGGKYV